MKATTKQMIELLDADERLELLNAMMYVLPPSAVEETFDRYQVNLNNNGYHCAMQRQIWGAES